jgi:hypothetical protein
MDALEWVDRHGDFDRIWWVIATDSLHETI